MTSPFLVDVFAESGEGGELLLEQETEAIEEEPAEEIPDENIAAEVTDDAADGEEAPEQDVCTAGDSGLAPGNRVWFYNIAGGTPTNSDMILIESNGRYGLIDAGNRYQDTIEDADGTVYSVPEMYPDGTNAGLSSQREGKNGRDAAIYMIETLGVDHLDFIIGTHAHSDHMGGIPEIADLLVNAQDGSTHYLIDDTTVFLYKGYTHISSKEDDLEGSSDQSWHNQAFVNQAVSAVENRGGKAVDISCGINVREGESVQADFADILQAIQQTGAFQQASYESRVDTNPFDDRLSLVFQQMKLDLYNLFSVKDAINENVNSIVTVVTDGDHKVYLGGDIDTQYQIEQKVAAAISGDHGQIDVVKASHHGRDGSNSKALIDSIQPSVIVCPGVQTAASTVSPSQGYTAMMYYAASNYATRFYKVGAAAKFLVVDFSLADGPVYEFIDEEDGCRLGTADGCLDPAYYLSDGWAHWDVAIAGNTSREYYYFENGAPVTGWKQIDGEEYYFDADGFMRRGWLTENGKTYYLKNSGSMATGWCRIDETWYYFGSNGAMVQNGWGKDATGWFWADSSGRMAVSRWIKDKGDWYYVGANGYLITGGWGKDATGWFWTDSSGRVAVSKWIHDKGNWYYVGPNGYMVTGTRVIGNRTYRFDSSGKWIR